MEDNIKKSFGDVGIYLFGSRVDDEKKGGDIDLAIDVNISKQAFRKKKIAFLILLEKTDFYYTVDVVNFNTTDELLRQEMQQNHIKIDSNGCF